MKKQFEIEMTVRDYECDSQGIVNHAIYLHYMENTRHEFMRILGGSFKESLARKIAPVVVKADLRYKISLTGDDVFISSFTVERKGAKILFYQTICRKVDNALCCRATIEVAILIDGKPTRGDIFDEKLKEYL
jgi:acyl-CoA thioester hydrolase